MALEGFLTTGIFVLLFTNGLFSTGAGEFKSFACADRESQLK